MCNPILAFIRRSFLCMSPSKMEHDGIRGIGLPWQTDLKRSASLQILREKRKRLTPKTKESTPLGGKPHSRAIICWNQSRWLARMRSARRVTQVVARHAGMRGWLAGLSQNVTSACDIVCSRVAGVERQRTPGNVGLGARCRSTTSHAKAPQRIAFSTSGLGRCLDRYGD